MRPAWPRPLGVGVVGAAPLGSPFSPRVSFPVFPFYLLSFSSVPKFGPFADVIRFPSLFPWSLLLTFLLCGATSGTFMGGGHCQLVVETQDELIVLWGPTATVPVSHQCPGVASLPGQEETWKALGRPKGLPARDGPTAWCRARRTFSERGGDGKPTHWVIRGGVPSDPKRMQPHPPPGLG